MAAAAEAARVVALRVAEAQHRRAVDGVVERREEVRARLPLVGDVGVAARAAVDVGGRDAPSRSVTRICDGRRAPDRRGAARRTSARDAGAVASGAVDCAEAQPPIATTQRASHETRFTSAPPATTPQARRRRAARAAARRGRRRVLAVVAQPAQPPARRAAPGVAARRSRRAADGALFEKPISGMSSVTNDASAKPSRCANARSVAGFVGS